MSQQAVSIIAITVLLSALPAVAPAAPAFVWPGELDAQGPAPAPQPVPTPRRDEGARGPEAAREAARSESTETRTFRLGRDGALSVSNQAGDITISGVTGDEARVTIVRRAYGATEADARSRLARTTVETTQHAGRLEVGVRQRGSHDRVEVELTITVPSGTPVDVRSFSGSVSLVGISGESRIETLSGDITARDAGALISAKTMSGAIRLEGCQSPNEMSASSVAGDTHARRVKARSCSFGSVSGELALQEVLCERAAVRTISGDVVFATTLDRGGRYEVKSHSGDVRLVVDGTTGFALDARTFSGELQSEFGLAGRSGDSGTRYGRRALQGLVGDGSAEVVVTTFSGDVTIARR